MLKNSISLNFLLYDVNGGSWEHMMANASSTSGSYVYNAGSATNYYTYSTETAKYIDTYAYVSPKYDQATYNHSRLGDGFGEIMLSLTSVGGWYGDYTYFFSNWVARGGVYNEGEKSGMFLHFPTSGGNNIYYISSRAVLIPLN